MVLISSVPVLNLLYFYISTLQSKCAVPNVAVFCSSLASCFPGTLLTYFLNNFEIVPVTPLLLLYNMYVSRHRHFFPVLLLIQRWSPPLRLQASHCSTFRIMCDVPSIAVFCSESIECLPGTASKFYLKLLVTIYYYYYFLVRSRCDPGVDSASNKNEYRGYRLVGKGGRYVGWQPYHLHLPFV